MESRDWLTRAAFDINARLSDMTANLGEPEMIAESIRYSLLDGGKRLRGALLLASNEAFGGDYDEALNYACALEMIHCFSLVHDDLPAMDDDDTRRGKPANHIKFGEGIAVLAGDTMLALAAEQMFVWAGEDGPRMTARVTAAQSIMHAASVSGIAGGQYMDILGESAEPWINADEASKLEWIMMLDRKKTASMFSAAMEAGAILATMPPNMIDIASAFGVTLGLAFQIRDDLLDIEGDPNKMGKRTGMDEGKLTVPALKGVKFAREMVDKLESAALRYIAPLGDRARHLKYFIDVMREYSLASKA